VDNHNLKTLLKARLLKTDGEKYLRDGGFFSLETIKTCIATRKYDFSAQGFIEILLTVLKQILPERPLILCGSVP